MSKDSIEAQRKFASKNGVTFPLLSDEGGKVIRAYGVDGLLGFAKRKTFLIDAVGKIAKVYEAVSPEKHAGEVAADLGGGHYR